MARSKWLKQRMRRCKEIFRANYPNKEDRLWEIVFENKLRSFVNHETRMLDAGAGLALRLAKQYAPEAGYTVGLDLSRRYERDEAGSLAGVCGDLEATPFSDGSFDLIFTTSLLEHLEHPGRVLREFQRILRSRGTLLLSTPNRWSYVSVVARLTPQAFHERFVGGFLGMDEGNVFPTRYRANTVGRLRRLAREAGFECAEILRLSQYPGYLIFSPLLFRAALALDRLTYRAGLLRPLRGWILGIFRKG